MQIPYTSWSISTQEYELLKTWCAEHGVKRVMEFGPGASSYAFLEMGCQLVSYEHDEAWIQKRVISRNVVPS